MRFKMSTRVLALCSSALVSSAPAFAQADATAPQEVPATDAPSADESPASEVVVTGTRLVRDGARAPTPVTVVSATALQQSAPSNIPDALNKLPIFGNSSNQATGATFQAGGLANRTGNFLNLRSLESDRVLVLLNGSRVPPTNQGNAVDTNVLPNLLISRVDVVTGGASAAYGSDAVTGVVNFVLDERFNGIKGVAQAGISDAGDNFNHRYGVAIGTPIGDRVHIIASYEHFDSNGVSSLYDRDWANNQPIQTGSGLATDPIRNFTFGRNNDTTFGGLVPGGPLATLFSGYTRTRFDSSGRLVPFIRGLPTNNSTRESGGDGFYFGREKGHTIPLVAPLKTDQVFARGLFDITDSLQFYSQGSYARSEVSTQTAIYQAPVTNQGRRITLFPDNPFLLPLQQQLASISGAPAIPATGLQVGRAFDDVPLMSQRSVTKFYHFQAGFKGELGSNWKWDVNYVNGRSEFTLAANEFDSRRYFAALDAVRDPASGRVVCRVNLVNPTFAAANGLSGCVPMNVLGEGNVDPAAVAFVRQDSTSRILNKMWYANANLQGDLFEMPAGAVRLAVGVEYREQTLDQSSNADPAVFSTPGYRAAYFGNTDPANLSIRGVAPNALAFTVTNVGLASGTQTVKEAYGELQVPLLKDQPFANILELNLAGRYTDYKTSGAVKTWKAGLVWAPVEGLRFRGTYSRDIAAPSLFSLFAGSNVTTAGVQDYLTIDPATGRPRFDVAQVVSEGNASLQPEFGTTKVLGVVVTPRAIPGLTVSVDAYDIQIKGAIQTTSTDAQLEACRVSGGTAPVCDFIERPGSNTDTSFGNFPTRVRVVPQNLASLQTRGLDFEIGYTTPLDSLFPSVGGTLSLRAFVNYLDKFDTTGSATAPTIHRAGRVFAGVGVRGLPRWKGLLTQSYSSDRFSISFNERFTGSYLRYTTETYATSTAFAGEVLPPSKAPSRVYVDANFTYDLLDRNRMQLFFNVQNLFNVDPPVLPNEQSTHLSAPTDRSFYDVIGRQFTIGVRAKF
jgi:iron complex outermembrane recepter protein